VHGCDALVFIARVDRHGQYLYRAARTAVLGAQDGTGVYIRRVVSVKSNESGETSRQAFGQYDRRLSPPRVISSPPPTPFRPSEPFGRENLDRVVRHRRGTA